MDKTDAGGVFDLSHFFFNDTPDKKITRKKRLDNPYHAALGRPLNPQARMKNFQIQILAQVGRRDVLMLGLCAGAIPGWNFSSHPYNLNDNVSELQNHTVNGQNCSSN
jgi:hypothetical protein